MAVALEIPGYRIDRQIGAGGMAIVYLAEQQSLGRRVALKVLNPVFAGTEEFSERFLNEGRILASLVHPNIVTIHDIGIHEGNHYISMEYVGGGDLRARMNGPVPARSALGYLLTIGSALTVAHQRGIVHRDLKPANILFREDGSLVLTDFGIAKRLGGDKDLTTTGATLGSPHYLSPEQARGKSVDPRTDVYSLGVILYEMLVGEKPIAGESEIDIIINQVNQPMPALPAPLESFQSLVDRMVAKSPDERFSGAAELVPELRTAWAASPVPGPGASSAGPPTVDLPDQPTFVNRDAPTVADVKPSGSSAAGATLVNPDVPTRINRSAETLVNREVPTAVNPQVADAPRVVERTDPARPESGAAGSPSAAAPPRSGSRRIYFGFGTLGAALIAAGLWWFAASGPPAGRPESATAEANTSAADPEFSLVGPGPADGVDAMLDRGDAALAALRLTTPGEDNALDWFLRVLEREPQNPHALRGIAEIAARYAALAEEALEGRDPETARRMVERGLSVDPAQPQLLATQQRIEMQSR